MRSSAVLLHSLFCLSPLGLVSWCPEGHLTLPLAGHGGAAERKTFPSCSEGFPDQEEDCDAGVMLRPFL